MAYACFQQRRAHLCWYWHSTGCRWLPMSAGRLRTMAVTIASWYCRTDAWLLPCRRALLTLKLAPFLILSTGCT